MPPKKKPHFSRQFAKHEAQRKRLARQAEDYQQSQSRREQDAARHAHARALKVEKERGLGLQLDAAHQTSARVGEDDEQRGHRPQHDAVLKKKRKCLTPKYRWKKSTLLRQRMESAPQEVLSCIVPLQNPSSKTSDVLGLGATSLRVQGACTNTASELGCALPQGQTPTQSSSAFDTDSLDETSSNRESSHQSEAVDYQHIVHLPDVHAANDWRQQKRRFLHQHDHLTEMSSDDSLLDQEFAVHLLNVHSKFCIQPSCTFGLVDGHIPAKSNSSDRMHLAQINNSGIVQQGTVLDHIRPQFSTEAQEDSSDGWISEQESPDVLHDHATDTIAIEIKIEKEDAVDEDAQGIASGGWISRDVSSDVSHDYATDGMSKQIKTEKEDEASEEHETDFEAFTLFDVNNIKEIMPKAGPRMKFKKAFAVMQSQEGGAHGQMVVDDMHKDTKDEDIETVDTSISGSEEDECETDDNRSGPFPKRKAVPNATKGSEMDNQASKRRKDFNHFDIEQILRTRVRNVDFVAVLKKKHASVLSSSERKMMVQALVSHLIEEHGFNPPVTVKEAMARSLIEQFPSLEDKTGVTGYEQWFIKGRKHHPASGSLEDRLRYVRMKHHQCNRPGGTQRKRKKDATEKTQRPSTLPRQPAVPRDESMNNPLSAEEEEMCQRLNHTTNASQISQLMTKTAATRYEWIRAERNDGPRPDVREIISKYPHILDPEIDKDIEAVDTSVSGSEEHECETDDNRSGPFPKRKAVPNATKGSEMDNQASKPRKDFDHFDIEQILRTRVRNVDFVAVLKKKHASVLSSSERKMMVQALVSHLIEEHGFNPPVTVKEAMARSLIEQFPSLGDKTGVTGYEQWFIKGRKHHPASGSLEDRLRYVRMKHHQCNRPGGSQRKRKTDATEKTQRPSTLPRQPAVPRDESMNNPLSAEEEEMCQRLKHTTNASQISQLMAKTAATRYEWIRAERNDGTRPDVREIISKYPHILDPEIIEAEFQSVISQKASPNLLSRWPMISQSLVSYAKKLGIEWEASLGLGEVSFVDLSRDEQEALLFSLLPLMFVGRARGMRGRCSKLDALQSFIDWKPAGTDLEFFKQSISPEDRPHPFILLLGGSRWRAQQTFVIVERRAIPCPTIISAIDCAFKLTCLLDIGYQPHCFGAWQFLQHIVYKLGGEVTTSSVLRFRSWLSNLQDA